MALSIRPYLGDDSTDVAQLSDGSYALVESHPFGTYSLWHVADMSPDAEVYSERVYPTSKQAWAAARELENEND